MSAFYGKGGIMAKKYFQVLDLSSVGGRVRGVLRKLGVGTVGELLAVSEGDILALKNCGERTVAEVVMLQMRYGKKKTAVKSNRAMELTDNLLKLHELQGAVLRELKKSMEKFN